MIYIFFLNYLAMANSRIIRAYLFFKSWSLYSTARWPISFHIKARQIWEKKIYFPPMERVLYSTKLCFVWLEIVLKTMPTLVWEWYHYAPEQIYLLKWKETITIRYIEIKKNRVILWNILTANNRRERTPEDRERTIQHDKSNWFHH